MNMIKTLARSSTHAFVLGFGVLLIAACAAEATRDPGAARVRADLSALQTDPKLANRAPVAMQSAEQAVRTAEIPTDDHALGAHRVYLADRKVQTTKALAQAQYAVDQRKALSDQGEQVRLDARTREADAAASKNRDLMAELASLKAKKTDRGIEMTLGDVLFSSGRSELKAGSAANLDKLAVALAAAPDRRVIIDGYTDSQGGDDMNMTLSRQRAEAVSLYLIGHGIDASRVTASGKGESFPVADNDSATGRQLNRRVVVTIQDAPQ
jgi:outer membrane protein OmpA-like peptidoglycan-associated protein